jgi:hypothetical protein
MSLGGNGTILRDVGTVYLGDGRLADVELHQSLVIAVFADIWRGNFPGQSPARLRL